METIDSSFNYFLAPCWIFSSPRLASKARDTLFSRAEKDAQGNKRFARPLNYSRGTVHTLENVFLPFWVFIRIGPLSDFPTQAEVALLYLVTKVIMNTVVGVGAAASSVPQNSRLGKAWEVIGTSVVPEGGPNWIKGV